MESIKTRHTLCEETIINVISTVLGGSIENVSPPTEVTSSARRQLSPSSVVLIVTHPRFDLDSDKVRLAGCYVFDLELTWLLILGMLPILAALLISATLLILAMVILPVT